MKKALYQQIEDFILTSINRHQFKEGEGLPSERDLARQFNSSHIPVRRATQNLVDRGVLYRINGKGTFVKPAITSSRSRTTRRIGILHCHGEAGFIHSTFYAPILAGIESELHNLDRVPMITSLFKDGEVFNQAYGVADEVDGLILIDPLVEYEERIVTVLRELNKPVVVVNYNRDLEGIDSIHMDDYGNMKKMAAMLIGQGHTRIMYVYTQETGVLHPNNERRLAGYRDALSEYGIMANDDLVLNYHRRQDKLAVIDECRERNETPPLIARQNAAFAQLMDGPDRPTAIMCAYDDLATRVMEQVRERNMQVPEDVSITGHDDTVVAGPTNLTTVYTPLIGMGKRSVKRLLEKIEERREGTETVSRTVLPGELVLRGSHGPVPHI